MGYESRLIIVRPTNVCDGALLPNVYAERYAQFDLGKLGEDFKSILGRNTKYYFFGDDGDARVARDEYGYPLREVDPFALFDYSLSLPLKDSNRSKLLAVALYALWMRSYGETIILHYGY